MHPDYQELFNTTNTNNRREILPSQHGNSIQHQHKSSHWEILTSRHGNSLKHVNQTHPARGFSWQQRRQKQTRWKWQMQKQGKQLVSQWQRIRWIKCLVYQLVILLTRTWAESLQRYSRPPKPQRLVQNFDFFDQKHPGHTLRHAFSSRIQPQTLGHSSNA